MLEEPKGSRPHTGGSYLSYLLRMWSMSGEGEAEKWLASVESPLTREQRHFADLESLFAFLQTMTSQTAPGQAAHQTAPDDTTSTDSAGQEPLDCGR